MFPKSKVIHFLVGMACAAIASPWGIVAAALVPVALGFGKELYLHSSGRGGSAENFAWTIAGAATLVLWLRLMPVRL